ncbi:MAG: hypothetical protein JWP89_1315 [Schlesneria sp.]|nr:hypothetical protein [Schlesneria sp.]
MAASSDMTFSDQAGGLPISLLNDLHQVDQFVSQREIEENINLEI